MSERSEPKQDPCQCQFMYCKFLMFAFNYNDSPSVHSFASVLSQNLCCRPRIISGATLLTTCSSLINLPDNKCFHFLWKRDSRQQILTEGWTLELSTPRRDPDKGLLTFFCKILKVERNLIWPTLFVQDLSVFDIIF